MNELQTDWLEHFDIDPANVCDLTFDEAMEFAEEIIKCNQACQIGELQQQLNDAKSTYGGKS